MKNAVIIGAGMVGKATMHELGIENFYSRSEYNVEKARLAAYKYIFLCLPTPTVNGIQEDDALREYIVEIGKVNPDAIFIVRSTVLPGFCRSFNDTVKIVHVPEFLTEETWRQDSEWPDIVVIGSDDELARREVAGIFRARHKGATFFITNSTTSEMIKYAVNTLYALKVVFANQLYDFTRTVGANYDTIKEALYNRKWVGKNHLDVFHRNKRGAGGSCLEKDLEAFAHKTGLPLLEVANKLNKGYLDANTEVN